LTKVAASKTRQKMLGIFSRLKVQRYKM